MDETEKKLAADLESRQIIMLVSKQGRLVESAAESKEVNETGEDAEIQKSSSTKKLEDKKKELEEVVQKLEKKWAQVQHNALKQPSAAQKEKMLDKQLPSLIEQWAVKQAQAEGLVSEIHFKKMELERLNGLWRGIESNNVEARNWFGRTNSERDLLL